MLKFKTPTFVEIYNISINFLYKDLQIFPTLCIILQNFCLVGYLPSFTGESSIFGLWVSTARSVGTDERDPGKPLGINVQGRAISQFRDRSEPVSLYGV